MPTVLLSPEWSLNVDLSVFSSVFFYLRNANAKQKQCKSRLMFDQIKWIFTVKMFGIPVLILSYYIGVEGKWSNEAEKFSSIFIMPLFLKFHRSRLLVNQKCLLKKKHKLPPFVRNNKTMRQKTRKYIICNSSIFINSLLSSAINQN